MKVASSAFKLRLAEEAGNAALCIRIVRRDGVQFGFTTWDVAFDFEFVNNPDSEGPLTYVPHGSFEPSEVQNSVNLSVDNLEISGVLSSNSLLSSELSLGLFEEAEVTFFRVDPEHLDEGEMIDKRGFIGQITLTEDTYTAELLSFVSLYKRNIGVVTSPTCVVRQFCNSQCKLDEEDFTHSAEIYANLSSRTTVFDVTFASAIPANSRFINGVVRVTYLGNVFEREIRNLTNSVSGRKTISLKEHFGFAISAATEVEIIEGCDRLFSTCVSLNNAENFRGFPHLPGTTQLSEIARPPD